MGTLEVRSSWHILPLLRSLLSLRESETCISLDSWRAFLDHITVYTSLTKQPGTLLPLCGSQDHSFFLPVSLMLGSKSTLSYYKTQGSYIIIPDLLITITINDQA